MPALLLRAPVLVSARAAGSRSRAAPARPATLAPRGISCGLACSLLLGHLREAADGAVSRVLSCAGARAGVSPRAASARSGVAAAADAGAGADADGMWLVVGLGNPGKQYTLTRHNVGFLAVDALAAAEGISMATTQLRALVGRGVIAGKQVLLVKPQTFMNSSGESVVPLLKFYKVPPSRLLVIYDDLDIDVAALRLRKKGGHGGHNGMRSIVTCLSGSQDFARLRIGIGRPQGQRPVVDHVLTTFDKREMQDVEVAVVEAGDVVRGVLSDGIDRAMSKYNTGGAATGGTAKGGGEGPAVKRARAAPPPPAAAAGST